MRVARVIEDLNVTDVILHQHLAEVVSFILISERKT